MRLATASASPGRRRLLAWAAAAAAGLRVPASRAAAAPARMRMVSYAVLPFGAIDDQGRSAGMFVELAERLSRESGVDIANVVVPYPRDRLGAALHVGDTEVSLYMSRGAHNAPLAEALARAATTLRGKGVIIALQEKYFGGLPKD